MSKTKDLLNDVLRVVLLALAIGGLIYLVFLRLDVSGNILLVLLGFGGIILVHEFGHFIIAKVSGIKVEIFSIFLPPTLIGIRRTHLGWRIRILPDILRKSNDPNDDGLLSFTIPKDTRPGTTEYRIGLVPFGGFVKMLGQDDIGPVKTSDDPRSYANKPAAVRAAVLAAGVTFNALAAIIVYIIVFLVGINLLPPVIGGVIPGSPADLAGLKAGDEVVAINGKTHNLDFSDIMMAAALSGADESVKLTVKHEDGRIEDYSMVAQQLPGEQVRLFGAVRPSSPAVARIRDPNTLFQRTGLLPGDRIKAVDGTDVLTSWQFEQQITEILAPSISILAERKDPNGLSRLVEGKLNLSIPATTISDPNSESALAHIASLVPRLRIIAVSAPPVGILSRVLAPFDRLLVRIHLKEKQADAAPKLQSGDVIVRIADTENPTYLEMRQLTSAYEGKPLAIEVTHTDADGVEQRMAVSVTPRRDVDSGRVLIGLAVELDAQHPVIAKAIDVNCVPKPLAVPRGASITAVDGVEVNSFYDVARLIRQNENQQVAIDWRLDRNTAGNVAIDIADWRSVVTARSMLQDNVPFADLERLYKAGGPIEAAKMGVKRTTIFIIQTYITIQRLLTGLISPKQLMGPVGILTFSYQVVASEPLIFYVYLLGLISASIAVVNFLPLPPLDGGLVVLLLVEKVKGGPLSQRAQEIIVYVGWAFVGGLFLYLTFNDIARSFIG